MSLFSRFTSPHKNRAKLGVFVATILLVMNLFASVDTITVLNGSECEQTGVCQYRMQFSSWFSINPSYPEDYDYYRNIKDPQNNWHSTNGTLLDCMSSGVCTAIASDHVDFNYTHPDSGAVVVNMQVEDYWGGDYAAATLNHSVELFTVPDPVFQSCITTEMDINGYTSINQITTLSCNSVALTSIEGVELLTSLVSLNIVGSSVSVLSSLLQTASMQSLIILGPDSGIMELVGNATISFPSMLEGFMACHYLVLSYEYYNNSMPFFKERCTNGACFYDYLIDEPLCDCDSGYLNDANSDLTCISWVDPEIIEIKTETPFFENGPDLWNDFYKGTQEDVYILGGSIGRTVDIYNGKFKSWEYNNGNKYDIAIYFHAAKPAGVTEQLPLLIVSHGGGGFALPFITNILAAELNMFVISYSGPGRGPYDAYFRCTHNADGESCDNSFVHCSKRTNCSSGCTECEREFFIPRDVDGDLIPFNYSKDVDENKEVWSTGTDHTHYGYLTTENIREDRHDKFFDSSPDPRGSWMWGHAVAAMRAITLASKNTNEIDMDNIAMIGGSAGGIATLLASSVDNRIKVAVPSISSLAIDDAVAFDNNEPKSYSWINTLRHCTDSGLDDSSSDWMKFIKQIVGKEALITRNSVPTLFLNGATDEFFPLNALNSTYNAMDDNSLSRISIQYNRGHIWNDFYASPSTNQAALMRQNSDTYHWLKSHLNYPLNSSFDDDRLGVIPNIPIVDVDSQDDDYKPEVIVYNPNDLNIEEVNFYYSIDQGLSYFKINLPRHFIEQGHLIYSLPDQGDNEFLPDNFNNASFYFADVIYDFGIISHLPTDYIAAIKNHYNTFHLSSQPIVPSIPDIIGWLPPTCKSFPDEPNTLLMW